MCWIPTQNTHGVDGFGQNPPPSSSQLAWALVVLLLSTLVRQPTELILGFFFFFFFHFPFLPPFTTQSKTPLMFDPVPLGRDKVVEQYLKFHFGKVGGLLLWLYVLASRVIFVSFCCFRVGFFLKKNPNLPPPPVDLGFLFHKVPNFTPLSTLVCCQPTEFGFFLFHKFPTFTPHPQASPSNDAAFVASFFNAVVEGMGAFCCARWVGRSEDLAGLSFCTPK